MTDSRTRQHFCEEMKGLEEQALGGLDLVVESLDRLLEVHQGVLSLLARQAPVATDLRLVAAVLDVIKHVERMGDQCVNIAKLLPLGGHEPPSNELLLGKLQEMGSQARSQVAQAKIAFERRDVGLAEDLVRQDEAINRLNREVFQLALDIG